MNPLIPSQNCSNVTSRLRSSMKRVKARQLSAFELAKVVSKPMLVIPQPILHTHECLANVRMTRVESNAYVALGIKEEPIDEEECERDGNIVEVWNRETINEHGCPENKEDRVRTRQQIKQLELVKKRTSSEDANNNNNGKETLTLSVEALNSNRGGKEKVPTLSIQPFAKFPGDVTSSATGINLKPTLNEEPPVGISALGNSSVINSKDKHSALNKTLNVPNEQQKLFHSEELVNNLDSNSNIEKSNNPTSVSKEKKESTEIMLDKNNEDILNDQPDIEEDFEFVDKMSSSSEDIEDIFREKHFFYYYFPY